jgi:hypothetical protein
MVYSWDERAGFPDWDESFNENNLSVNVSYEAGLGFRKSGSLFVGHSVFFSFLGNLMDTFLVFRDAYRWVLVAHSQIVRVRRGIPFDGSKHQWHQN